MAKNHRRARPLTLPLATLAGTAGSLSNNIVPALQGRITADEAVRRLSRDFTGYDPIDGSWRLARMGQGLLPLAVGVLVSMMASRFGINRRMARSGIPLIRV